ncbi:hypothetical protein JXJ21_25090 [candidate division KSB1 bacterium]|nr:hypothetical protein [candidate division KSB1 bacterium]
MAIKDKIAAVSGVVAILSVVFNIYQGITIDRNEAELQKLSSSEESFQFVMTQVDRHLQKRDQKFRELTPLIESARLEDVQRIKDGISEVAGSRETLIRLLQQNKYSFLTESFLANVGTPELKQMLIPVIKKQLEEVLNTKEISVVQEFVDFVGKIDENWILLGSRSSFFLRSHPVTGNDVENMIAGFEQGTLCRLLGYTREKSWLYVSAKARNGEWIQGWVWKPLIVMPAEGPFS